MSTFYQLYDRPSNHSVLSLVCLVSRGEIILQSGLGTLLLGLKAGREHLVGENVVSKFSFSDSSSRLE